MLSSHGQDYFFFTLSDLNSVSANEPKIGYFLIDLQRTSKTKEQLNSDSQIAVYYHPCNQNTNDNFGPLKEEEI